MVNVIFIFPINDTKINIIGRYNLPTYFILMGKTLKIVTAN